MATANSSALPSIDRIREVLSYDPASGVFRWKRSFRGSARAGDVAGSRRKDGYIRIKIDGAVLYAHRLAWLLAHGSWPEKFVDHINGNPSDNRIENLRDVNAQTNCQNRRVAGPRKNGGTLLGAHWCTTWKRWKSSIIKDGKCQHIGWFPTEEAAHTAYVETKRRLHAGCTL